jgi:Tfp pilus assembly protein PilF
METATGRTLVNKVLVNRRTLIVWLAACMGLCWLIPTHCPAQDVFGSAPPPKSSFTGSIKQGFSKVGEIFTPKSDDKQLSPDDPLSLKNKSKPSAELYSAIARLYEEAGKNIEAEQYYQMALKEKPDDLNSLLGYAKFQENQGRINEAVALYQKAVQTHPKEAGAYNNLGLCYARRNKLNEAAQALGQAVQLDPRNLLYRNNLATVLVDQNRLAEAFANLRDVHGDAVAYYNMGYLLNKKGKLEAAEHHFAQALRSDPTMVPAQKWLNYLHGKSRESAMGAQTNDSSVRVGSMQGASRYPAKVISPPITGQPSGMSYSTSNQITGQPSGMAYSSSNQSNQRVSPAPNTAVNSPAPATRVIVPDGIQELPAISPQTDEPPLPPTISTPQRLPPVSLRQPAGSNQSLRLRSTSDGSVQAAPLPPIN